VKVIGKVDDLECKNYFAVYFSNGIWAPDATHIKCKNGADKEIILNPPMCPCQHLKVQKEKKN
jgi:hypothetical protein